MSSNVNKGSNGRANENSNSNDNLNVNLNDNPNNNPNEGWNSEQLKDEENIGYEKPDTHTNFWKSFGLDTKAGKLLYNMYGEKSKITPALIKTKMDIKKDVQPSEPEEPKRRKPQVSYPMFKKEAAKKKPIDTIPHKKPLSKILEETKNYESIKELPVQIERNRNLEKKKLSELFFEQKCKVLPPSCSSAVLTEEERKEIIESSAKNFHDLRNSNCREEKIIESMKIYQSELIEELQQKVNQYKHILSLGETNNDAVNMKSRSSNEFEYKKIELINEIEECKRNIEKTNAILNSYK
ncbi:hypothetical protein, conserved [Plasmodium gonderi]|uniref:Enkurin domain-containing protein n=1 Tax=Plasmodium gonderi TaxID=77519 RepID=A0A1Y1JN90_PLAGO|nr:hypothetical protein, conserved [Plasmodium gonderi]GAW82272.1 hypothetical protein, conserved [Plasmodium gonderi]